MRKIPELLAPAGGFMQLKAAVENGADAVYMGGKSFNARMSAENFDEIILKEAVNYAHMRGVQVHVAMNTLLTDEELPLALHEAWEAYEAGVDALIIQNLGFAQMIRQALPQMCLHLSTQGTVYNLEGVRQAEALGFSRVVLAREVSLEEIKKITKATDTEIEVFVHGALCICYSGQCQMSRVIGGRSGNKGACAQPCRLPYKMIVNGEEKESGFLLSPKDFCAIDQLNLLAEAGVASLKIEGRLKSPEYVALVTSIYRKYLDEYKKNGSYVVTEEDRFALKQVFNRGGFSNGYLFENPRKRLLSGELAKHQGTFLGTVQTSNPTKKQVTILLKAPLSLGDGIEIHNEALNGNVITYLQNKEGKINLTGNAEESITVGSISGVVQKGDLVYKITDKALMEKARDSYEGASGQAEKQLRKRDITMKFSCKLNSPSYLLAEDGQGHRVEAVSDVTAQVALHKALEAEAVKAQLSKTGGTPFRLTKCEVEIEEGVALPISVVNALRRQVISKLEVAINKDQRKKIREPIFSKLIKNEIQKTKKEWKPKIHIYLFSADEEAVSLARKAQFAIDGKSYKVSRLYVPYLFFLKIYPTLKKEIGRLEQPDCREMEVIPYLPSITKGFHDETIKREFQTLLEISRQRGISVGNLGWIDAFVKEGGTVYGDYGLNLYNQMDFEVAEKLGIKEAVLSHECGGKDMAEDFFSVKPEAVIGEFMPLMTSAHCPMGDLKQKSDFTVKNCLLCRKGQYFLKDRKGEMYPVLGCPDDCTSIIFSANSEIDQKKYREAKDKSIETLRIYGIDKTIFCIG